MPANAIVQLTLTAAIEGIKQYQRYQEIAARTGELSAEQRAANNKLLADAMASDRWKTDEELGY